MGLFITFEGCDGCGKTTQIDLLKKKLIETGCSVSVTREPGGTTVSDQIRKILLNRDNSNIVPLAELLLYEASRAQHVQEFIRPTLVRNKRSVVICDRFYDASTAYQAGARSLKSKLVEQLNTIATDGLKPDLTFYIDIDPATGLSRARTRMKKANSKEDRFERENLNFHTRVRSAYLNIAEKEPDRIKVIDGSRSIEEIHAEILEHVKCFLSE